MAPDDRQQEVGVAAMLRWAGKGWLAQAGTRERSLDAVRAHIAAEVDTRADVIMTTVSRDPWFPLPDRERDGITLTVLDGTDDVHRYYSDRAEGYVVLASSQLKQLTADWYVFNESAATLRQTGAIGDVGPTHAEFVVQSAVLFPTASDGIRGEIALTRYPFADVLAQRVPPRPAANGPLAYLPVAEVEHTDLLDRVADGLRRGDLSALVTEDHQLAIRVDDGADRTRFEAHNGADAAKELGALFAGADDLTLVSRVATEWYVFGEYLAALDGGARLRRVAAVHPVRDGRLEGTFGYGFDTRR